MKGYGGLILMFLLVCFHGGSSMSTKTPMMKGDKDMKHGKPDASPQNKQPGMMSGGSSGQQQDDIDVSMDSASSETDGMEEGMMNCSMPDMEMKNTKEAMGRGGAMMKGSSTPSPMKAVMKDAKTAANNVKQAMNCSAKAMGDMMKNAGRDLKGMQQKGQMSSTPAMPRGRR